MTPTNTPKLLPESILTKLHDYQRSLFRETLLRLLLECVAVLGCGYLVTFALDRFGDSPAVLRGVILVTSLSWALIRIGLFVRRWMLQPYTLRELCVGIQQHHRQFGDRLQGIIELAEQPPEQTGMSPELCRAAIQQVAQSCEYCDFREAVPWQKARRQSVHVGLCLIPLVILGLWVPVALRNGASRFFQPWAGAERYTFAHLQEVPDTLVVLRDEPFSLRLQVDKNKPWQPENVQVVLGGMRQPAVALARGRGILMLVGPRETCELQMRLGDSVSRVQIVPVSRPAITGMQTAMTPPTYTGLPVKKSEAQTRAMHLLPGSSLGISLKLSSELSGASAMLDEKAIAVNVHDREIDISLPELTADPESGKPQVLTVSWNDQHGFEGRQPFKLDLYARNDQLPQVACPDLPANTAILADEAMEIAVVASDDLGLRNLQLSWEVRERGSKTLIGEPIVVDLVTGAADKTSLNSSYALVPHALNIPPGSIVEVRAVTRDFHPDHPPVYSQVHRLYVFTAAEHAEILRQQLTRLQDGLEQLARQEEALLARKDQLLTLDDNDLGAKETLKDLREQEEMEARQSADLRQLAKDGAELLQEAMRNPEFSPEFLKEMADMLASMKSIGDVDMPGVQQETREARQTSRQERRAKLGQARQSQAALLEKLKAQMQQLSEGLESMSIGNFATRLRELEKQQRAVHNEVSRNMADLVGRHPSDLNKRERGLIERLTNIQDRINALATELQDELKGFNTRINLDRYLAIQADMESQDLRTNLAALKIQLQQNQIGNSLETSVHFANKFKEWADSLESLQQGGSDGGGSGGGQQLSEEELEIMMTLLRVLQEEHTIRSTTRLLEKQRQAADNQITGNYQARSVALASRQMETYLKMVKLERLINKHQLDGLFDQAGTAMIDAGLFLKKPQTDMEPVAAQTQAIELLGAMITQAANQSQQSNPQLSAMMMQLLQMQMNMGGGESASGGTGSQAGGGAAPAPDDVAGPAGGNAAVEETGSGKASGQWSGSLPEEYRQSLETYYRNLDMLERQAVPEQPK